MAYIQLLHNSLICVLEKTRKFLCIESKATGIIYQNTIILDDINKCITRKKRKKRGKRNNESSLKSNLYIHEDAYTKFSDDITTNESQTNSGNVQVISHLPLECDDSEWTVVRRYRKTSSWC